MAGPLIAGRNRLPLKDVGRGSRMIPLTLATAKEFDLPKVRR
jgi:hypothetical protein